MARMKFLCDADRCIECNACVTACKNENEVPWGINRRRVVTIDDGKPGERSVSMACMHCTDAPCAAVCPVNCFYTAEEFDKYGANRLAEGKLPMCAEMCSTKSLLAGDGEIIAQIYKERVMKRGYGSGAWGWKTAYREEIAV